MKLIRKGIFVFIAVLFTAMLNGQSKQGISALPDMQQLLKMSPAELEAYKKKMLAEKSQQIKTISKAANIQIDETLLPDYELKQPVKDLKRLALIPSQPPSFLELSEGIKQTKQQLEANVSREILSEVKQVAAQQTGEELQSSSLAYFSSNKPLQSLLLSLESVVKNTQSVLAWNNLAGIMNMGGLEHKSIPILQYWLVKYPQSSLLLNNMGQAYMGLRELTKAEQYLGQCLQVDALHPEANRTMGIICLMKKEETRAQQYFEKEMQAAYRKSSMALMKKRGIKFNLYQLRKRSGKIPGKNFFEEIALSRFKIPEFPKSIEEVKSAKAAHVEFMNSVMGEIFFWANASVMTPEEQRLEGNKQRGIYHDFVVEALKDLHQVFHDDLLLLFREDDINALKLMTETYAERLSQVVCFSAPLGSAPEVILSYQKKCCDLKNAITNEYLTKYNTYVNMKAVTTIGRWKDYLNGLINIASLSPSAGNKSLVYGMVKGYFSVLAIISQAGLFPDPAVECMPELPTAEEADNIIESNRNVNMNCPSGTNVEVNLVLAKLKADCSKFAIEVGGGGLVGAFEKEFKTGTYTFMGGVGVGGEYFFNMIAAEAKQQVYISFDNNNNFSDFGIKGSVELGVANTPLPVGPVKIGGTLMGVEAGYTLGFNSGFNTSVEGKGFAAGLLNK